MEKGNEKADPTSWLYQAAIHGTLVKPALPSWNRCTHGTWFFVAWHRMYVFYFENIVRSAIHKLHGESAAQQWALPYWNYCRGGEYASIPDAFREPTVNGARNPLYVQQRRPGINSGWRMPDAMTESVKALARPHFVGKAEFGGGPAPPNEQFWNQSGVFEYTPHGSVHVGVGGNPNKGWMANILTAAKDPIFWLHHANIDRIWSQWLAQPNRKDPDDPKWRGQRFDFFDPHGHPASKVCGEIANTEKLHYKYDDVDGVPSGPRPAQISIPTPASEAAMTAADPPPGPKFVGASERRVTLTGEPAAVPVAIEGPAREEVRKASSTADPRHVYLNVEDIEGEVNPGTVYGIYVNLPRDADEKTTAKHHVGNVSFFGLELAAQPAQDEHGHSMRVSVEVGELLRALGGGEYYDGEQVDVTFLPLSLEAPEGEGQRGEEQAGGEEPVHIGRVSLSVDA